MSCESPVDNAIQEEIIEDDEAIIEDIPTSKTHVYICLGQSNAHEMWAAGINDYISKRNSNTKIIHSKHPGDSIGLWVSDNTRNINYLDDLEIINNELNLLETDSYIIAGLFWFQGEGDYHSDRSPLYQSRFTDLYSFLKEDLNLTSLPFNLALIQVNSAEEFEIYQDRVNVLRGIQFNMAQELNGISHDTSYYNRRDMWHLWASHFTACGNNMAEEFLIKFPFQY